MIHYALKCSADHRFESWFQSAAAFDKLQAAGMVACAVCGISEVDRDLMAPRVSHGTARKPESKEKPLSTPATAAEQALAELKKHIEKTSEDVGRNFAREARAIHLGEAPSRAIRGEAKPEEARQLVEEGVPIAPLPFRVGRKSN